MTETVPEYIVVEGPIGVGKTTLAKKLAASFGTDLILEAPEKNPFLERFYQKPAEVALPTQLFFLFQRARQIQAMRQGDLFRSIQVTDYLIEKDRLFAELNLNKDEFELYEQVYTSLTLEAPIPDLVIYLQAPVQVLMQRIVRRGTNYEKRIEERYLQRLIEAYIQFFYHYDNAPLLIVNAEDINFADNERDYELLLERIKMIAPGRHYFNPAAEALL